MQYSDSVIQALILWWKPFLFFGLRKHTFPLIKYTKLWHWHSLSFATSQHWGQVVYLSETDDWNARLMEQNQNLRIWACFKRTLPPLDYTENRHVHASASHFWSVSHWARPSVKRPTILLCTATSGVQPTCSHGVGVSQVQADETAPSSSGVAVALAGKWGHFLSCHDTVMNYVPLRPPFLSSLIYFLPSLIYFILFLFLCQNSAHWKHTLRAVRLNKSLFIQLVWQSYYYTTHIAQ